MCLWSPDQELPKQWLATSGLAQNLLTEVTVNRYTGRFHEDRCSWSVLPTAGVITSGPGGLNSSTVWRCSCHFSTAQGTGIWHRAPLAFGPVPKVPDYVLILTCSRLLPTEPDETQECPPLSLVTAESSDRFANALLFQVRMKSPSITLLKIWCFKGPLVKKVVLYRTMNTQRCLCMIKGFFASR